MASDIGGVWRTIGGRRVFIKDGQSVSDAMKESGKFNKASRKGNSDGYNRRSNTSKAEYLDRGDMMDVIDKWSSEGFEEGKYKVKDGKGVFHEKYASGHLEGYGGKDDDFVIRDFDMGSAPQKEALKDLNSKLAEHGYKAEYLKDGWGASQDIKISKIKEDKDIAGPNSPEEKKKVKEITFKEALNNPKSRDIIERIEEMDDNDPDDVEYRDALIKELKDKYGYQYKLEGPDSPEVKKINKPIDKENREKEEQYKKDKGLREISKDPEAMKARLEEMKQSGEFKEILGEPDEKPKAYSKEDYAERDRKLDKQVKEGIITKEEADYKKLKQDYENDKISREEFDKGRKEIEDRANQEAKRKAFREATEGLERNRKEAEEYKNAIEELRTYSIKEAENAEDTRPSIDQIKDKIKSLQKEYYKKERLGEPKEYKEGEKVQIEDDYTGKMIDGYEIVREATLQEKQGRINSNLKGYIVRSTGEYGGGEHIEADIRIKSNDEILIDKVKNYKEPKGQKSWTAEEAMLAGLKERYDVKGEEGIKGIRVIAKSGDNYIATTQDGEHIQIDYSGGKLNSTIGGRVPEVYGGTDVFGGKNEYKVNWAALGNMNTANAREYADAIREAADFADKLNEYQNSKGKGIAGVSRDAYQKYLKDHPNSKMSYEEFKKMSK